MVERWEKWTCIGKKRLEGAESGENRQWIRKGKEIGGMGRLGRRKGLVE